MRALIKIIGILFMMWGIQLALVEFFTRQKRTPEVKATTTAPDTGARQDKTAA